MFKIRNPFKPKNVNIAKVVALKQLQVIEALQKKNENQSNIMTVLRLAAKRHDDMVDELEDNIRLYRLQEESLIDQQLKDKRTITALNAIISNLRKQKVYSGQKFYNPEDHRAPTVYLCARWNDWYIVRQSNQVTPSLITAEQWQETYGHLVVMPQMNSNIKNLGNGK